MKPTHALALALALAAIETHADTVTVPIGDAPPNRAAGVPRPVRGMSMDDVTARFGEPLRRLPPVGDPPITRWVYERFTVYFEHQTTVHAVVNKPRGTPAPG